MKKEQEDVFFHIFDQCDSDQALKEMERVEFLDETLIEGEVLVRIKAKTFEKLGLSFLNDKDTQLDEPCESNAYTKGSSSEMLEPGKLNSHLFRRLKGSKKRNGVMAASLVIVTIIITSLVISPDARAQILNALQFIPGFAKVQDTNEQVVQFVLPNPIIKNVNGGQIEIRGLSISENRSFATINGSVNPTIRSFVLKNGKGQEFIFKRSFAAGSEKEWTGSYYYEGPIEVTKDMELLVEGDNGGTPIDFVKAQQVNQIDDLGVTDAHQGISLTAITRTAESGKTRVALVPQVPYGTSIEAFGFSENDGIEKPELTKRNMEKVAYEQDPLFPNPNEIFFYPNVSDSEGYKLSVPEVTVIRKSAMKESFIVPIPLKGEILLNQTISVQGFPVDLTKVERIPADRNKGQKDELKIYVNTHYNKNASESLLYFIPDTTQYSGSGYSLNVNEQTRSMDYISVEIPSGTQEYKFYVKESRVLIRGQWVFQLH